MTPGMTKQNTAQLVGNTPTEKLAFWTGYKAALVDAQSHTPSVLMAMSVVELEHARKEKQTERFRASLPSRDLHKN